MEISVNEDQQIQIERAFNGVKFVTVDGEELYVCMRDTGYELVYENTPIELKNGAVNESQQERIRELEGALEAVNSDLDKYKMAITSRTWRKVKQALRNAKKEE